MPRPATRRQFLKSLGIGSAALPFVCNLPSLAFAQSGGRKQRLVVVFSPNGTVPWNFWPDEEGEDFTVKEILKPLECFKDRMLVLNGLNDQLQGDGDSHMHGIGCLLTGIELFPGNIQGGSHTPAGWATGLSIDQEIKNYLQSRDETRTRFGSLEFGVCVPDRADTWTRMVYTGPNRPVAPIDDPYQMFDKLYGRRQDEESLGSVLDDLQEDLSRISAAVSEEDRRLIEEHATHVREMERELQASRESSVGHAVPQIEQGVDDENDNIPTITKMQIDLMVDSFVADFSRVATLQITNSVGQPRMTWLGIEEGHHEISHEGDDNTDAQDKLTRINQWYCGQVAYLVRKLSRTPEPGGEGTLLDNTLIVWTNELGQGNSHTLDNIPFVLVGNGLDFRMGRSIKFGGIPHNRLLMSLAHGFGHHVAGFGNPDLSSGGVLSELT